MGYILIGIIWCGWLEWYTTKNPAEGVPRHWIWRERVFHTLLWPVSLSIFIREIVRYL